jgi:hypothetical protein
LSAPPDAIFAADFDPDGDVTLLTSYELARDLSQEFEAAAKAAVKRSSELQRNIWLLYEEFNRDTNKRRYFTVHFPHSIEELTEPNSATSELISAVGQYRDHVELTRQVPAWCSTTSLDANLLTFAYAEYLWLTPDSLESAGRLLAKRGEILRAVYGTTSEGNSAAEGFISMVAPAQLMLVLFSSESTRRGAVQLLELDLVNNGLLGEWRELNSKLESLVTKRSYRAGRYRPDLSHAN